LTEPAALCGGVAQSEPPAAGTETRRCGCIGATSPGGERQAVPGEAAQSCGLHVTAKWHVRAHSACTCAPPGTRAKEGAGGGSEACGGPAARRRSGEAAGDLGMRPTAMAGELLLIDAVARGPPAVSQGSKPSKSTGSVCVAISTPAAACPFFGAGSDLAICLRRRDVERDSCRDCIVAVMSPPPTGEGGRVDVVDDTVDCVCSPPLLLHVRRRDLGGRFGGPDVFGGASAVSNPSGDGAGQGVRRPIAIATAEAATSASETRSARRGNQHDCGELQN